MRSRLIGKTDPTRKGEIASLWRNSVTRHSVLQIFIFTWFFSIEMGPWKETEKKKKGEIYKATA